MAEYVESRKDGKFFFIELNRPNKKNAINAEMYVRLADLLVEANHDPEITFTVLTGKNDFFCSGSDFDFDKLTSQFNNPSKNIEPPYYQFISQLIEHQKILIALVNGPAIGIGVTLMSLFDLIVAVEDAYFVTPFTQLGLTVEGTSSYTFPQLMGRIPASRMLLFSEKLTAAEAQQFGLITHVLPRANFANGCQEILKRVASLAPEALVHCKSRIRNESVKREMRHSHEEERQILARRWQSSELFERMAKVFGKNKKSKI